MPIAPETSSKELHVGMDVPRHAGKQIYEWVKSQAWPAETDLEHPGEYHVTLLYTHEGHEHKDAPWIDHLEKAEVVIDGLKAFPAQEKGYAYVLTVEGEDVQAQAESMQALAEWNGLPVSKFDGGYKPHITVAYGPSSSLTGIKAPNFQFDIGPSSVSPSRPPKEASQIDWARTAMAMRPEDIERYIQQYGPYLYHGGPTAGAEGEGMEDYGPGMLESFQQHGLQAQPTYRPGGSSFLSPSFETAYSYASAGGDRPGPVYRVDIRHLDPAHIRGDEWRLLPDSRYPEFGQGDWDMNFPDEGFNEPSDVWKSLENTAPAITYTKSIPPEHLEHVGGYGFPDDQEHPPKTASHAPEPPNYRLATSAKSCGTCKMFDKGQCWGYGNKPVKRSAVCDSWAQDKRGSTSMTDIANDLHTEFERGADVVPHAKRLLSRIGYPTDEITLTAALQAWQQMYPQDTTKVQCPQCGQGVNLVNNGDYGVMLCPRCGFTKQIGYDDQLNQLMLQHTKNHLEQRGQDWGDILPRHQGSPRKFEASYSELCYPLTQGIRRLGGLLEHCPNCHEPLSTPGAACQQCSTVPSQVNSPDDHWPEFGDLPPDRKRDIQFSNDWAWHS